MTSTGRSVYRLSFEISPIILTGGVAGLIPGSMLPIVALTQAASFIQGLLAGSDNDDLSGYFAHFAPIPSATTLIDNQIGTYPFANQSVAANAIITQPLKVSLRMDCPANGPGGYAAKLATLTALQATLAQHIVSGGTFIVATPSFVYTNCILTGVTDISSGETSQPQTTWRWDFVQPLLTIQAAQNAQSQLMQTLTNGGATDGNLSGSSAQIGNLTNSDTPNIISAAQPLSGSSTSGTQILFPSL